MNKFGIRITAFELAVVCIILCFALLFQLVVLQSRTHAQRAVPPSEQGYAVEIEQSSILSTVSLKKHGLPVGVWTNVVLCVRTQEMGKIFILGHTSERR